MTFNFKTYQQQALTTALPSALTMDYLAPGLIAELGEVFGKQAKAVRDGWDGERLNREIIPELGDCMWFIALIGHVTGTQVNGVSENRLILDDLAAGMDSATQILVWHDHDGFNIQTHLEILLNCITSGAVCNGTTLEAVAQANLDKLADRQARNVIAGSGDTR